MEERQLPVYLRDKVANLRCRGPQHQELVEKLLEKRAHCSAEKRRHIDQMLVQLDKPSRAKAWLGVIALAVVGVLGYHAFSEHSYAQAVAAGKPTVARVQRLDPGDCLVGQRGLECVRLTLELHPTAGAPYVATLERRIAQRWVSRIQPGSWLTVAVDAKDPQQVYFDERTMAVEAPKPVTPSGS